MAESNIAKDITDSLKGIFTNVNVDRLSEIAVALILCFVGFVLARVVSNTFIRTIGARFNAHQRLVWRRGIFYFIFLIFVMASLKEAGFHNISIDLIYALPGQTLDQVKENVAKALALDIPHLSLYSLMLEHHTIFMNKMRRGKLNLPTEDLEAEMFTYIINEMEANGFEHYEISNFSKPGFYSQHNLMYWNNDEYYGCGAGASGYLDGVRYRNRVPIQHYLSAVEAGDARLTNEVLKANEKMEEELFLSLRKKTGVSKSRFQGKFGISFDSRYGQIVDKLVKRGLLQEDQDQVRMTKKGLFLGDSVAEEFILE